MYKTVDRALIKTRTNPSPVYPYDRSAYPPKLAPSTPPRLVAAVFSDIMEPLYCGTCSREIDPATVTRIPVKHAPIEEKINAILMSCCVK